MTISVVAVTAPVVSTTTAYVVNKPTGMALNQSMLMAVMIDPTFPSFAIPSGWLEVPKALINRSPSILVLWKIVGASEPSSYTLTFPSSVVTAAGIIGLQTNVPGDFVYPEIAASMNGASPYPILNTRSWPSVNVTAEDAFLVFFGTLAAEANSTPSVGLTEHWDTGSTRQYCMTVAFDGPGATPTPSATTIVEVNYCNVTVAMVEGDAPPFPGPHYRSSTASTSASVSGTKSVTMPTDIEEGDMLIAELTMSTDLTQNLLPKFAYFDDATNVVSSITEGISKSMTVTANDTTPTGILEAIGILIIAPPTDTKRLKYQVDWSATTDRVGGSSTTSLSNFQAQKHTSITQTGSMNYVQPTYGTTTTGTGIIEDTYTLGAWPINRDTLISAPPTSIGDIGARIWIDILANAFGVGNSAFAEISVTVTVLEIELDSGHIYTPSLDTDALAFPAGWEAQPLATQAANNGLWVYTKIAEASDAGAVLTATWQIGTVAAMLGVTAFRSLIGRELSIESAASRSNTASTTITYPDFTTEFDNAVVAYLEASDANNNVTSPTNAINRHRVGDATAGLGINSITREIFAPGSYTGFTATQGGSTTSFAATLVIVEEPLQQPEYYAVAPGHDAEFEDLERLIPQPQAAGFQVTRKIFSHNRQADEEFVYTYLKFNVLGSREAYQALLLTLDLIDNKEADMTMSLKDDELGWGLYNVTLVRPKQKDDIQWDMPFPKNIAILVKYIELIPEEE